MSDLALFAYVWQRTVRSAVSDRIIRDESGEGVISAAIAVLVMAFLGVAMWFLFKETLTNSNDKVNTQIDQIQ
jgi:ABC-type polysaccharide/polyol phosphate export permease